MEWVIKRAGPGQMQGTQDAVVRLRGLPFGCSKEEIAQWYPQITKYDGCSFKTNNFCTGQD
jgi:heterogeneous nuclear ribonucleoprotein F/H